MTHIKKILPEYFEMQIQGIKKFEIRKNDCDYQVGDRILLEEHQKVFEKIEVRYTNADKTKIENKGFTLNPTGRFVVVEITCVVDYEQKDNYVVLGTKELCRYLGGKQ